MKNILKALFYAIFIASVSLLPYGCISEGDGGSIEPNFGSGRISLSELKKIPIGTVISDDVIITVTVCSDPTSMNLPQGQMFVQDNSCRGICVSLPHEEYAHGDVLEINLLGASTQINADGLCSLDGVKAESIVKIASAQAIKPVPIRADQISLYESMFVRIDKSQITNGDKGKHFSGKINFETEYGRRFVIYTYSSANFASEAVPEKYGYIEGIASMVNGKRVLLPINNESYANLTGERCTPPTPQFSLSEVRDMDAGVVKDDIKVTATVISDNTDGNFDTKMAYVQDIEKGAIIEFTAAHNMSIGQDFTINLNNTTIQTETPFKIIGVDPSNITLNGNAHSVNATPVTLELLTRDNTYESRLVKVTNIQSGINDATKTFGENTEFEDASGAKLSIYTSAKSIRRSNHIPPTSGSVIGVVTATGAHAQLSPRTNSDFSLPNKGPRLDGSDVIFFTPDNSSDIFISEVVHGVSADGQSVNAVELFNPTSATVDMTNYMVVLLLHDSNTDMIIGVAKQNFDNAEDFPRGLKSGESLVVISQTATDMPTQFDKTKYPYYKEYAPAATNILGSKGNAPFVLMKNTGTPSSPVWTEIDRVGVPNTLDAAALKAGETDIDNYSGKYKANPSPTSKSTRGWNRGRTWTHDAGYGCRPGNDNLLLSTTLDKTSWSALSDKKTQYKLDIANTACDPRNGGWTQVSLNTATSAGSAKVNTTLGWHVFSVAMVD